MKDIKTNSKPKKGHVKNILKKYYDINTSTNIDTQPEKESKQPIEVPPVGDKDHSSLLHNHVAVVNFQDRHEVFFLNDNKEVVWETYDISGNIIKEKTIGALSSEAKIAGAVAATKDSSGKLHVVGVLSNGKVARMYSSDGDNWEREVIGAPNGSSLLKRTKVATTGIGKDITIFAIDDDQGLRQISLLNGIWDWIDHGIVGGKTPLCCGLAVTCNQDVLEVFGLTKDVELVRYRLKDNSRKFSTLGLLPYEVCADFLTVQNLNDKLVIAVPTTKIGSIAVHSISLREDLRNSFFDDRWRLVDSSLFHHNVGLAHSEIENGFKFIGIGGHNEDKGLKSNCLHLSHHDENGVLVNAVTLLKSKLGGEKFSKPIKLVINHSEKKTPLRGTNEGPWVQTNGWDTVYGVPFSTVNKYFKSKGLKTFDELQEDNRIAGNFGEWSLVPGSTGNKLNISVPVTSGNFSIKDVQTDDLANVVFTIELSLDFIGGFDKTSDPRGKNVDLKFSTKDKILVTDVTGSFSTNIHKFIIIGLMQDNLNKNFSKIEYIFANVNIDNELAVEYKWIAPTLCHYTIYSPLGRSEPFLAILTLTGDKESAKKRWSKLSQEVSPGLIPKGSSAGFAISPSLFIQNFVVPAVNETMNDSKNADFGYDTDHDAMVNRKKFNLDGVTYLGITYTPYCDINSFQITIKNGKLVFSASYTCPISPGIRAKGTITQYYSLSLKGDKFTLDEDESEKREEHHADVDSWVTIVEVVVSLVVAVASLVVGVLAETANAAIKWLLIVIIGAVLMIIVQIPQFILLHGMDALSNFELSFTFIATGLRTINWAGMNAFKPISASLENCLLLGGDPILKSQ